jgi:DNA-binding SARP family transcriptional activator
MRKVPEEKPLSIRLLGPPEATLWGRGLRFGTKKALALLCYLAAEGKKYPRGQLAELLWPRSDRRSARTDLRSTLSRLRKALGEDGACSEGSSEGVGLFAVGRDLLGVEPRGIELDLRTLEAAVSLARSETSVPSPGGRSVNGAVERRDLLARLESTLEIYRGEFMEGFSLVDAPELELWIETERTRWRALFGELCGRVARLQAEAGRSEEAIGTARLWTKHAPLEEDAHLRLIELLSFGGDAEGALRAYEDFRVTLRRELGSEPPARLTELADRLREEVGERASLGTGLAHSTTTTTPLSALEIPFVGRQQEFGALVSEYETCVSGQEPRVVAVMGEAGMGKTRLVKEFLGWAKSRGADVLKGAASEGAVLSYGPLVEAIRPRMERERAPEDLLDDAWLSELSRLLPELKERYPDLPSALSGEGETAEGALFEAVARAVGALASHAPVVLFLDDLQWADAATVEVLEYARRRWAEQGAPVLVLIAGRPEELEGASSFVRWLLSLGRRLPARSLTLPPLRNEDIEKLLRRLTRVQEEPIGSPGEPGASDEERSELERFGGWLAAETGGQPFYLAETLKALLEEGRLAIRARPNEGVLLEVDPVLRVGGEPSSLPNSVREVVRGRLSRLSPSASELLTAGAVLSRRFGFGVLVAVAGLGETEGLRGIDELVGRHLLIEEGGGREEGRLLYTGAAYSFSHEKIRQVAYTECGQARRWVLHRRAFGVIERRGAPPAELARHALAGGLAKEAFAYSMAAGDEAAEVFAVRDAISHYERTRDLLAAEVEQPGGAGEPSISNIEHLYSQLGRTYEMADRWEKARETYETMLALAREMGEARLEVITLNHLAVLVFHHEGDTSKARALLERAERVAEEASLAEALAETECKLVDLTAVWAGDFEYSEPLAEKALASARALDRPDLVARVLTALARLESFAGRLEEARTHAEEGAALSRELAECPAPPRTEFRSLLAGVTGLSASWRAAAKGMEIRCRTYIANVLIYLGRLQEGMAAAREVRDMAEDLPERMEMMSLWAIGNGLLHLGEYEEVLALARRGVERARKARDAYLLGANLGRLGEAYEALMNLKEARAAYEEAMEVGHYGAFSYARYCVLAAVAENWEDAHAHAKRAYEVGMFFIPMFSINLHCEVEALLHGGDKDLAREEVRRFAERAKMNGRDLMSHLRALAVLDEWEGDTERALGRLRKAEALAEEIGLPGELWQIGARIGELRERRGEVGEAQQAFSRAAQTLRDLAAKIKDVGLREGFLAAPKVRRVLAHEYTRNAP